MSNQDKPTPLNKSLYNKVLNEARSKFKRFPSLYASSWISREYQSRGGNIKHLLVINQNKKDGMMSNGCK